jgi:AcrR family transcriptional regulator
MTQFRGEETRSRILDVAGELFAQHGYDATSVADICERAGVTKGGFYHHFTSKEAVFLELRDRWLQPLEASLTLPRNEDDTLPQILQNIADMAKAIYLAEGEQQRRQVFLELLSAARHDPTILPALLAPMRKYHELLANLIEDGIQEGTLRQVDRDQVAHVLVSLGFGLIVQSLLDPHGADWGTIGSHAIPLLMQGLEEK